MEVHLTRNKCNNNITVSFPHPLLCTRLKTVTKFSCIELSVSVIEMDWITLKYIYLDDLEAFILHNDATHFLQTIIYPGSH